MLVEKLILPGSVMLACVVVSLYTYPASRYTFKKGSSHASSLRFASNTMSLVDPMFTNRLTEWGGR